MHTSDVQEIFDNAPWFIRVQPSIRASIVNVVVEVPYSHILTQTFVSEMIPLLLWLPEPVNMVVGGSLQGLPCEVGSYEAGNRDKGTRQTEWGGRKGSRSILQQRISPTAATSAPPSSFMGLGWEDHWRISVNAACTDWLCVFPVWASDHGCHRLKHEAHRYVNVCIS